MLCAEDRAILDFECASWQEPGPKDQAIEMALGLGAAVYYERLRLIVEKPSAREYDPLTTRRVKRLIEDPHESEMAV